MRLERLLVFPDVDDEGMVRRYKPINDTETLGPKISLARVAIAEQRFVGNLFRIER